MAIWAIREDFVSSRRNHPDLEAALEQFREIALDLGGEHVNPKRDIGTEPHHEDLCI
jgi:hypothetical protein